MEKHTKFSIWYYLFVFFGIMTLQMLLFSGSVVKEIPYSEFRERLAQGKIESVVITQDKIYGRMKNADSLAADNSEGDSSGTIEPPQARTPWRLRLAELEKQHEQELKRQFTVVPLPDDALIRDLQAQGVTYRGRIESNWFRNFFLNWIIPFGLFFLLWGFIFQRMRGGAGVLNVGKSKAKIYAVDKNNRITFKDVAGIDEAVQEVREVVDFLKQPEKYSRLGAKLPKGLLLVGPPGTGKTLLARAVAGEAGVPFFSLSGSDFVEMFVGVGAARVRDLFTEAKAKAPCIIFIDEIDAIGKSRGQGPVMGGGYDERENTLNQLLTEMDGFDSSIGIIIMGATNRPEVLDPALLRPGRFDRQVLVDRPDLNGRVAILKIHTRTLKLGKDVDLEKLAAQTPGFAGAELANICNEAALLASRKGRDEIRMDDFQDAVERVIAGLEKKNKLINKREREIVAYHESGHAIVGHCTPGADPVQKVSIVPRGMSALGYTLQTPLEDRYLMSREELLGKIKGLLGGRAAEEIIFGEISTGASNDLEKVAQIARDMIVVYGMSEKLPNLSLVEHNQGQFLNQGPGLSRRSEKIEQLIDEEVLDIIRTCYDDAKNILQERRDKLEKMAALLLEKEVIDDKDIVAILGPRPGTSRQTNAE